MRVRADVLAEADATDAEKPTWPLHGLPAIAGGAAAALASRMLPIADGSDLDFYPPGAAERTWPDGAHRGREH